MLENIKRYMAENPLRACIRRECPQLMERQLHLWIGGREYAAFGNLFLLKYPIKEQVFFHRKDPKTGLPTEQTTDYQKEHNRLLRIADEGTVLVPQVTCSSSPLGSLIAHQTTPVSINSMTMPKRYAKPLKCESSAIPI